uniref:HK97 family phage prohead protease n=1 Tax=Streptococcus pneumoniae TaxID=1313 RepID=UPI001EFD1924
MKSSRVSIILCYDERTEVGALDSLSIGFFINDYEPVDAKQPYGGWIFKEVEIFEISVV